MGEALHIVGDQEAPVVDMAKEMNPALWMARSLMEEFKSATSAEVMHNAEKLAGITKTYEQAQADFDTFAVASDKSNRRQAGKTRSLERCSFSREGEAKITGLEQKENHNVDAV